MTGRLRKRPSNADYKESSDSDTPRKKLTSKARINDSTSHPTSVQSSPFTHLPTRESPIQEDKSVGGQLHASAKPDHIPCRENEYDEIFGCLQSAIDTSDGTCLCECVHFSLTSDISGVPGSGKTLTVQTVMKQLLRLRDSDESKPFDYLEMNGMKLTDPSQAYTLLWEKMSGNKGVLPKYASSLLDKHFSKPRVSDRPW